MRRIGSATPRVGGDGRQTASDQRERDAQFRVRLGPALPPRHICGLPAARCRGRSAGAPLGPIWNPIFEGRVFPCKE